MGSAQCTYSRNGHHSAKQWWPLGEPEFRLAAVAESCAVLLMNPQKPGDRRLACPQLAVELTLLGALALELLGAGDPSCLVSPIRDHAFFEQAQFERLLGNDFLQLLGHRSRQLLGRT